MLNFLFPFDDRILKDYQKKPFPESDIKIFFKAPIILLVGSLVFALIQISAHSWRVLYILPLIVESFCALLLEFSPKESHKLLGYAISMLSLSNFVMVICIIFIFPEYPITTTIEIMLISGLVFLILVIVGYRIHYFYELKHGEVVKKNQWSSGLSTIIVLAGISLAKLLSRELIALFVIIIWIGVHLALSKIVLVYRKYMAASNMTGKGIKKRKR